MKTESDKEYLESVLAQHGPDVQYFAILSFKNVMEVKTFSDALIGCYVSKYIKGLRA
jgi:hypothetical protein